MTMKGACKRIAGLVMGCILAALGMALFSVNTTLDDIRKTFGVSQTQGRCRPMIIISKNVLFLSYCCYHIFH